MLLMRYNRALTLIGVNPEGAMLQSLTKGYTAKDYAVNPNLAIMR